MDRLQAMQAFVKVVELGSFSAAADQLDLSKSAVSKMVRALEDHLGARLLNRTTRRLSITEAGGRYVEEAARILADLAEVEARTADQQAVPRGRLKVNAPMSFGLLHLSPLLPGLLRAHPDLIVDLTLNDRVVDLLDEGVDVAIRIGRLRDSSLVARKLCEVELILVASPGYLAEAPRLEVAEDLSRHEALVYAYGPLRDEWRLEVAGEVRDVPVQGRLRANNGEVLVRAAVDRQGIALSPDFIAAPHLADGTLIRVLPAVSGGVLPVHALYPANRHPLAKLTAFVDYLKQHLAKPAR
ncbi:MAG: LysR substrate-binding domain-containing protein [Pseudomonadota bacterium]